MYDIDKMDMPLDSDLEERSADLLKDKDFVYYSWTLPFCTF